MTLVTKSVRNFAGRGVVVKQLPKPAPIVEFVIASLCDERSEALSALKVVSETGLQRAY